MTRITRALALITGLLAAWTLLFAGPAAAEDEGKAKFLEYKCNKCHAVESQGIEVLAGDDAEEEEDEWAEEGEEEIDPPDLSNAGADFESPDEITEWIKKKAERNGRLHKSKLRAPKKDIDAIAAWVFALRKE
jgi:hypothetical protein